MCRILPALLHAYPSYYFTHLLPYSMFTPHCFVYSLTPYKPSYYVSYSLPCSMYTPMLCCILPSLLCIHPVSFTSLLHHAVSHTPFLTLCTPSCCVTCSLTLYTFMLLHTPIFTPCIPLILSHMQIHTYILCKYGAVVHHSLV